MRLNTIRLIVRAFKTVISALEHEMRDKILKDSEDKEFKDVNDVEKNSNQH